MARNSKNSKDLPKHIPHLLSASTPIYYVFVRPFLPAFLPPEMNQFPRSIFHSKFGAQLIRFPISSGLISWIFLYVYLISHNLLQIIRILLANSNTKQV